MEICPDCGSYMEFHMEYFCGNPVIYYTCPDCGYDSRNVSYSDKTTIISDNNSSR